MSITLAVGPVSLELDPDLLWADENGWFPVEQTIDRTVTGALIVSFATRVSGRPITLRPEDDSSAWMLAVDLAQLNAWAAIPGLQLTLTLRGVARTVIFRHHETPMEATPLVHYRDVVDGDWYLLTLRFMEI